MGNWLHHLRKVVRAPSLYLEDLLNDKSKDDKEEEGGIGLVIMLDVNTLSRLSAFIELIDISKHFWS